MPNGWILSTKKSGFYKMQWTFFDWAVCCPISDMILLKILEWIISRWIKEQSSREHHVLCNRKPNLPSEKGLLQLNSWANYVWIMFRPSRANLTSDLVLWCLLFEEKTNVIFIIIIFLCISITSHADNLLRDEHKGTQPWYSSHV